MIKSNATIVGTISRSGEVKTDKQGRSFLAFGIQTELKSKEGKSLLLDISVAMDGNDPSALTQGTAVKLKGTLSFRKRDERVFYNLSAKEIELNTLEEDSISGTMSFRGTLGKKEIEEKNGKKGAYRCFDAYSSDRIGEGQYAYIWVHFLDVSAVRPQWLQPKASIDAEGEIDISVFNERESIGCRITALTLWDKTSSNK